MTPTAHTIPELIAAHRIAIRMDEAAYNDDGEHISGTADESEALEKAILRAIVAAPCATIADVQAKAGYFLNGTVGHREPVMCAILGDDGCDLTADDGPLTAFLRSLIVPAPQPAPEFVALLVAKAKDDHYTAPDMRAVIGRFWLDTWTDGIMDLDEIQFATLNETIAEALPASAEAYA